VAGITKSSSFLLVSTKTLPDFLQEENAIIIAKKSKVKVFIACDFGE